jgi:hypothetical protein
MVKLSEQTPAAEPQLTISTEEVCAIIAKARQFDVKVAPTEISDGSNPSDDREVSVIEDTPDDPVASELRSLIDGLDEERQVDLVALVWLGRDDFTLADWPEVRAQAASAHKVRTSRYLMGNPLLGDHLEDGLAVLGRRCD